MSVQWYPGHMTKTRRQIEADLKQVDAVAELCDARIPLASRNPDIDSIVGQKPRLLVLNRSDQADPEATALWMKYFRAQGLRVIETDSRAGAGVRAFPEAIAALLKDKLKRRAEQGQSGRTIRVMVVGVPNVGKSTFINRLAGRKSAKTADRPGVTRGKQWITVGSLDLLDTPGILWPRFEDMRVGELLAFTGAVKDNVTDVEALACTLISLLARDYPDRLAERFKADPDPDSPGWQLLERAALRRGFIVKGGEPDTERAARVLLDEYRAAKFGRITLERPPVSSKTEDG